MKKIFLFFVIIFLIVTTTLIKNSTKKLENQIFTTRENISVLKVFVNFLYLLLTQVFLSIQREI